MYMKPNKMKRMTASLLSLLTCCYSLFLFSCSSDEEGKASPDYSAPAHVTDLQATPIAGGVVLSWKRSPSNNFMYAKVAYTDAKGVDQYVLISAERADSTSGLMTTTVRGFAKEKPVTFNVYACNVKGNHGDPAVIEATPQAPNFIKVLDKVKVTAAPGGAYVAYANDFDETVKVKLVYSSKGDASKKDSTTLTATPKSSGNDYVRFDYGSEILSGDCQVAVTTLDVAGNESDAAVTELSNVAAIAQVDKSTMSVPGYNANSSDGTIGYSSQEAVGEGKTNGRVVCLFDNNLSTFYHSRWKGDGGALPQWFIIDLGKDYPLAQIELFARQDSNGWKGQKGHQIFVCADKDAVDKNDPTSWSWKDCGEHSFDPANKKGQIIDLSPYQVTARYIKVYIAEKYRGNGVYAFLSEINVFYIK